MQKNVNANANAKMITEKQNETTVVHERKKE